MFTCIVTGNFSYVPTYKSILIKCVDLLIKRIDLSEMCYTHWVDLLAELL